MSMKDYQKLIGQNITRWTNTIIEEHKIQGFNTSTSNMFDKTLRVSDWVLFNTHRWREFGLQNIVGTGN